MKSLTLAGACAAVALVAANTPARETAAQPLGEYYQPGVPSIVKAFVGARVIDGTDRAPIPGLYVAHVRHRSAQQRRMARDQLMS